MYEKNKMQYNTIVVCVAMLIQFCSELLESEQVRTKFIWQ